jgi:hypothetical protein
MDNTLRPLNSMNGGVRESYSLLQGISFIPVGKDGLEIYVSRRKK